MHFFASSTCNCVSNVTHEPKESALTLSPDEPSLLYSIYCTSLTCVDIRYCFRRTLVDDQAVVWDHAYGVLHTSETKVLLPVSETEIRIVGGIYDGETMTRDPQSGAIVWQTAIYERL